MGRQALQKIADLACSHDRRGPSRHKKGLRNHKIHDLRGHLGQKESAENLLALLEGSGNALPLQQHKVQDPYTLRCAPQIHGATRDAVRYAYEMVSREINAVTDNPIVFPDEDEVLSGGNFHGPAYGAYF